MTGFRDDLNDIKDGLRGDMDRLSTGLLGKPSKRTPSELRFGRNGSVSVVISGSKAGSWYDNEAAEGGGPLDLIQHVNGCAFRDALDYGRNFLGMVEGAPLPVRKPRPTPAANDELAEAEKAEKFRIAMYLWRHAVPIEGTPAQAYLQGRKLSGSHDVVRWLPPLAPVRHPDISTKSGRHLLPVARIHEDHGCLIMLATDGTMAASAVQRVFLNSDGSRVRDGNGTKLKKLSLGRVSGSAVKLSGNPDFLILAEGLETAWSLWMATGFEVWAGLGGMGNVKSMQGLRGRHIILGADGEPEGTAAYLGVERALASLVERAASVKLARAPLRLDWQDIHQSDGLGAVAAGVHAARRVGGSASPLPPYFPAPHETRSNALARQEVEMSGWFRRAEIVAMAARDIDRDKREAWEAAGLTAAKGDPEYGTQQAEKSRITREIRARVCADYAIDPDALKSPPRLLVTGGQGTGKTREVIRGLVSVEDPSLVLSVYQPTLGKAEEFAREYAERAPAGSPPVMVIRGRKAPDPGRDDGGAMCLRHEIATKAAKLRVNVKQKICAACPFALDCGYLKQDADIEAQGGGVFVMANEYLFLPSPLTAAGLRRDLIIIDEDVTMKAAAVLEFTPSRIKDSGDWTKASLNDATEARGVADKVHSAVVDHPGRELEYLRSVGVTDKNLKKLRSTLNDMADQDVGQIDGGMSDAAISRVLDAVEQSELGKVARLVSSILLEWSAPRPGLNGVIYNEKAKVDIKQADGSTVTEYQPRVSVHFLRSIDGVASVPLLMLDGTGSPDLVSKVFGDVAHVRIAVDRLGEVIQVTGKTFSRNSLIGRSKSGEIYNEDRAKAADELRANLINFIRETKRGATFVAATKSVREALEADIGNAPDIRFGHFGAVRGFNEWEGCDTAIIVGREQPNFYEVEKIARAFAAADAEPMRPAGAAFDALNMDLYRQARGRRMKDGTVQAELVTVHPDPRAQAVLEQIREADIIQAVDRVRAVFNTRRIFILSSVVVDISVDRVERWGTLRKGGTKLERLASGGFVPLSAAGMSALRPDLWSSEKAAEHEITRGNKAARDAGYQGLADQLGEDLAHMTMAEFRREGAKKWSPVWFDRERIPDPAAKLADLFGCEVEVRGYEPAPVTVETPASPEARPVSAPALILGRPTYDFGGVQRSAAVPWERTDDLDEWFRVGDPPSSEAKGRAAG